MKRKSALVAAAHPDDEVLGCGGTIARWHAEGWDVHVILLADGESSRATPAQGVHPGRIQGRIAAAEEACRILGCTTVQTFQLPDNRMDSLELLDVVRIVERHVELVQPHTVFTHHPGDVNVDHRITHDAVLAACRPQPGCTVQELLFFEVPSSTEWGAHPTNAFVPNLFVDISTTLALKMKALQCYAAEMREFPHSRSLEAVEALAKWRGATAGVAAAEAFVIGRKIA